MSRLTPHKLHVSFTENTSPDKFSLPRRYTLTHSDATGDLFLTIGPEFDQEQTSGWYTKLMRDEVFAEWRKEKGVFELHLFCHVSGGIVFGPAGWRYRIFRQHMPMVLEAFRYGDREIFLTRPELDASKIRVHFSAWQTKYNLVEDWGQVGKYQIVV